MLSGHEVEDGTIYPTYEFRHLTFQEYLAARAIVDGYYPDRCETDTLLSVLATHLANESWKEIIPLGAVLSGRKVEPLIRKLIDLAQLKPTKLRIRTYEHNYATLLLGQCILDEIQISPEVLDQALITLARRRYSIDDSLIRNLSKGRYADRLTSVVENEYLAFGPEISGIGGSLAEIPL